MDNNSKKNLNNLNHFPIETVNIEYQRCILCDCMFPYFHSLVTVVPDLCLECDESIKDTLSEFEEEKELDNKD